MQGIGRDHRVDFYRGIALLTIFVNHVPGTVWETFTTRNFGFSDSADLFVFLAGFASAVAYGRWLSSGDPWKGILSSVRRAGVLYLVHVATTMAVLAILSFATLATGDGRFVASWEVSTFLSRPLESLVGIATLGHQIGYANILPLYCVLMLMVGPMILAWRRLGAAFLIGPVVLWIAAGTGFVSTPSYPSRGGWFLEPMSWQLIFAIGLWCGLERSAGRVVVPYRPVLHALACAWLVAALAHSAFGMAWAHSGELVGLPFWGLDKTHLALPRIAHLLAAVYVFANAPASSPLSRIGPDDILAVIGRHSLPVFCVGTLLSIVGQTLVGGGRSTFVADTSFLAAGMAILAGLAWSLEAWRRRSPALRREALEKTSSTGARPQHA